MTEPGEIKVTLLDGQVITARIRSNSVHRLSTTWEEVADAVAENRPVRFTQVEGMTEGAYQPGGFLWRLKRRFRLWRSSERMEITAWCSAPMCQRGLGVNVSGLPWPEAQQYFEFRIRSAGWTIEHPAGIDKETYRCKQHTR